MVLFVTPMTNFRCAAIPSTAAAKPTLTSTEKQFIYYSNFYVVNLFYK